MKKFKMGKNEKKNYEAKVKSQRNEFLYQKNF